MSHLFFCGVVFGLFPNNNDNNKALITMIITMRVGANLVEEKIENR